MGSNQTVRTGWAKIVALLSCGRHSSTADHLVKFPVLPTQVESHPYRRRHRIPGVACMRYNGSAVGVTRDSK